MIGRFRWGIGPVVSVMVAVILVAVAVSSFPVLFRKIAQGYHPRVPVGLAACVTAGLLMLSWRWLRRARRLWFLGTVLVVSAALRLWMIAAVPNLQVSDFAIYHEFALGILSGHGFAVTGPAGMEDVDTYLKIDPPLPYPTAFRPPGTPFFAAALYRVFGTDPLVFKLANVVLGSLIGVLIFLILSDVDERLARAAALLWSLYPSAIFATNLVGSEVLFTFLLLMLALVVGRRGIPYLAVGAVGLLAAAAIYVRALLGPLTASVLVAIASSREPPRRRLAQSLVFVAFLGVALAPWTIRNWRLFHHFIPTCTNEGRVAAAHTRYIVPDTAEGRRWLEESATETGEDEAQRNARSYGVTLGNVREMLRGGSGHTLVCLRRNMAWLFASDEHVLYWSTRRNFGWQQHGGRDLAVGVRRYNAMAFVATLFYGLVLLGALLSILAPPARAYESRGFLLLAVFFVINSAIHAVIPGVNRYHFSHMPFLMALAAAGYRHGLTWLLRLARQQPGATVADSAIR